MPPVAFNCVLYACPTVPPCTLVVAMAKGAGTPVPAKATTCGALEALSLTVRVPVRVPVAVGVNLTPAVQLAPPVKELEQVP